MHPSRPPTPTPAVGSSALSAPTGSARLTRAHETADRVKSNLQRRLRVSGVEAAARLAWWAFSVAAGRAAELTSDLLASRDSRATRRSRRREREMTRLVNALGSLKGAFAKAGQFASLRVDLTTPEQREALATLQAGVAPLAFEQIAACIEAELGDSLDRRFVSIDPVPLGAASIAQVHRAQLPDGTRVAVKVQYPWIAAALPRDLAVASGALWLLCRLGRRQIPDRARIVEEFGRSLADELDFEREAAVAREIAGNLAADPQIVVPEVISSHSSARVLTMTYRDAVGIGDLKSLAELGVDPADVLQILARAYAKQVFVDGLFHADPHPGNLFVLREPTASETPRVLFVDFGLSKRLSPELRRELRKGIYSLLQRDLEGFLAGMDALGMIAPGSRDRVARAVERMFERIADSGGALGVGSASVLSLKDEAKTLLAETPGLQLPSDLLLYAKTVTYLFGLGELLDPRVDLMKISLPYLLKFLAQKEPD